MSPDSIPHLSLGTALLAIFLICVVLVFLRGMTRILIGTIMLAISGWIGLITWHHSPALCYKLFEKPITPILIGLPIIAFAATFFLLFKILGFVLSPLEHFGTGDKPRTSIPTCLIVALVPTSILFLLSAGLLHHFGSIEELRAYATGPGKPSQVRAFLRSSKSSLDTIIPPSLMDALDPVTNSQILETAKLTITRSHTIPQQVIDPETGKPYPRAIIVDDPELQSLARKQKFGTLLRHPLLTKATSDPTVQTLLKDLNL